MKLFTALACIAVALTTPCAATEIITLPLELGASELYVRPGDDYQLAFDVERELLDVSDVRLHVVGTYTNSRSFCWNFGNFGGGVWSYREDAGLLIGLQAGETQTCVTQQVFEPVESGVTVYDFVLDLHCGDEDPDWSFLSGGSGIVHLTGLDCYHFPEYPEICICEHSAMVSSAELIIELGTGVAIETWHWGVLKDRYR